MTIQRLERGARLPPIELVSTTGERVALRGRRGPLVLLIVHPRRCSGCQEYVGALAARADRIAEWGATVLVVQPGKALGTGRIEEASGRLRLVDDPEAVLAAYLGPEAAAAVLVADEWGEIFFAAEAGPDHQFPSPDEIADWVRFVAIQCPECEQPEGEWRTM